MSLDSSEWDIEDAVDLLDSYKTEANVYWEKDLINWIIERLHMYESLLE